ncbi:MAG: HAD family phosphatase [Candidatus Peregrinibacteria bacterium]|nr:HAD family phosphatase [Candidatus Peregrinibacteria bacterium]
MTKIRGLIFDLDGTITLTQQFHYQAFSQVFAKYGITYTENDDLYKYAGMGSGIIFPTVFADHGLTLTPEQIKKYSDEKKEIYDKIIRSEKIEPVTGVEDFLKRMQSRGYRMCVASGNKLESIEYLLDAIHVRTFFEFIVTNKDADKPKPAPDIFLAAAKKFGFEPEECVVFEDAVNGITAAESAGMTSVGIATRIPEMDLRNVGADIVVNNYHELSDGMIDETLAGGI